MRIEVDESAVDKLISKRVAAFEKKIKTLENKLKRRDSKIHKLERELEMYKAGRMDTDKETSDRIAKIARALVGEMQRANWVEAHYECGTVHYADYYDS